MTADDWSTLAFQAGKIFTPTSPIDEKELFSGRTDQIRSIIDVINQKGQHAMIYGERGVGKTSLVSVLADFLGAPNVLAPRVNCDSTDTFDSVWRKSFDQISMSRSQSGIGFNATDHQEYFPSSELLGREVTPESVKRALVQLSKNALPIIIIDEFDRLPPELRKAFADTIKALSDYAVQATIILVGVADSVDELIAEHQSVERALVQIQMPRMSNDEIRQILSTGLQQLKMEITPEALKRIAVLAQGLPHYAHLLGLHSVRFAIDAHRRKITADDVMSAIEKAVSGANQSIRTSYDLAVRSTRRDNLFTHVLVACALAETSDLGFFAAKSVEGPMRSVTGRDYEIPSFAQHLNEFCDEKRGPILQKSGTKRLYRYRFVNPLMQPYVIMQGLQKQLITGDHLH